MKRFVALVLAAWFFGQAGARAEGPDDQYVTIYNVIEQGDSLKSAGSAGEALAKYAEAQSALLRLQRLYPDWNPRIVSFRLNYLASQAAALGGQLPKASALVVTNRPAASPAAVVQSVPAAPAPKPAPPAQAEKPDSSELEQQINMLKSQVLGLQADKSVLEAKLKEALAAQPAALDPRELARAQQQITALEKENELLKVTVSQEKSKAASPADSKALAEAQQALAEANRKLADQIQKANALAQDKQFLASKLSLLSQSQDNAAALETTKKALADANRQLAQQKQLGTQLASEKEALDARVKSLSAESDAVTALRAENALLKKQAAEAKAVPTTPAKTSGASRELAQAQAQLAALESDRDILRLEKTALANRVTELEQGGATVAIAAAPNRVVVTNTVVMTKTVVVTNTVMAEPPKAEDSARVKALQRERDEVQKKLEAATKELESRHTQASAARVTDLENELVTLHARLDVFETRQVPYTAEELALFSKPEPKLADTNSPPAQASSTPPPAALALVAKAQRYFANHQFDQAEAAYTQVLQQGQTNVFTLANLATVQLEDNRLDAAETNLVQALALAPNDAYSLSILGYLRYRQQRYNEALDALSRAAKLDPQNAQVQNYLGIVLAEKGLRGPAETAFRKAIQLDPTYADAHNNLAVIYISQQPPAVELARWHYQRALAAGRPHDPYLEKKLEIKQ
jgi:Flp pilus assembly protein TadD